ncbi:hypothetical protein C8A05DRAFT_39250 [Staphylotrichum tortipilum]|uniref:Uncharacterized protein n=1 Tax=Staphylotrichum tortipilum TaxID=2831512 RepID=A0AAN6MC14_9PEZI|nr:hypothetical protein C8A05DRAFT_39250 [Staphylotrichum longicolle]
MHWFPLFGAVAILSGVAAAAADQSTSRTPTTSTSANPSTTVTPPASVRVFLKLPYAGQGICAASVASVCKDQTVYAVRCTCVPDTPDASQFCGPDAPTFTVTAGPSTFMASYGGVSTMGDQVASATTVETCHITPTGSATCIDTVHLIPSAGTPLPKDWPTAGTGTVIAPATFWYRQVAVTAGGDKLASATEACQPTATNVAVGLEPRGLWAVSGALVVGVLGMLAW